MQCEVLHDLFERVHCSPYPDETYDVPGNTARKSDQMLLGPIDQWGRPGQGDQPGVRLCREEPGHESNLDINTVTAIGPPHDVRRADCN